MSSIRGGRPSADQPARLHRSVTRKARQLPGCLPLLLILALTAPGAVAADKVVLQLKWLHQFQFAGYYAAVEQGYYAEEGLDVEIRERRGNRSVFDQVVSGEADFGIGDSGLLLEFLRGRPVVAMSAIFQHDPLVLIALESSAIDSPYDLVGKRIMYADINGNEAPIHSLLALAGISAAKHQQVDKTTGVDALIDGRVDAMSGFLTNQVQQLQARGQRIRVIRPSSYGLDFYGDTLFTSQSLAQMHPDRVDRFNRASLRGWRYALDNVDRIALLIHQEYSQRRTPAELLAEAAGIRALVLPDAVPIGDLNPLRLHQIAYSYQQLGLIGSVDERRLADFTHRPTLEFSLTDAERRWLREHPIVRLGVNRDLAPIEWIDDSGDYRGLVADYFQLLEDRLGIRFEIDPNLDRQQTLAALAAGKIDLISDASRTADTATGLSYSPAFFESQVVIASDTRRGYIGDLANLAGRRVAIEDGYFMLDILRAQHPEIELVVVDNQVAALRLVAAGKADAYLRDAISLNYAIQQEGLLELRHSGTTPYYSQHRIAVPRDHPLLLSIMSKTLDSLDHNDRNRIVQKWLGLQISHGIPATDLAILMGFALTLVALMTFYLVRLRRSERARQESEQLLDSILDNLPINIYLKDRNSRFIYANRRVCEFLGKSRDEVIGSGPDSFFDDSIAAYIRKVDREAIDGEPTEYEEILATRGNPRPASYLSKRMQLRNSQGEVTSMLGVSIDISQRVQAESRDKMRSEALELLAVGRPSHEILHCIATALEREFEKTQVCLLLADENGRQLTPGAAPSLPRYYLDALDGLEIVEGNDAHGTAAATGERVIVERLQTDPRCAALADLAARAGLESCWSQPMITSKGAIVGVLSVYHQSLASPTRHQIETVQQMAQVGAIALERSRQVEALATQEEFLRSSIEAVGEGFVVFDAEDRLVFCNDQCRQVYRSSASVLKLGNSFRQMLESACEQGQFPDAIGRESQWIEERMQRHLQPSSNFIQRLDDGRYINVRERRTSNGHTVGFRFDITELVKARDDANQASIAKSRFLATMSHELRTPMNGVLGMLQLLEETDLDDEQKSCIEAINQSGKSLLSVINDILDFSRLEAGMVELDVLDFSLPALLEGVVDMMRGLAVSKSLKLSLAIDPTCAEILRGDAAKLRQVLINLVGNAIKFTADGEVGLNARYRGERLVVEVTDTGIGIEPAQIEHLFDEFSQADQSTTRRFGGTGLGLSISRRLVSLMSGEIQVRSTPGKGSCFELSLPFVEVSNIDEEQSPAGGQQPGDRPELEPLGATVLLVEDVAANQLVAKKFLRAMGCEVLLAENGEQAVQIFDRESVDLVLMDCRMPGMDGYQATHLIRQLERKRGGEARIPILALTANAFEEDIELCHRSGMDDVITKPYRRDTLYEKLRFWLKTPLPRVLQSVK